jgi:hypothetical protein
VTIMDDVRFPFSTPSACPHTPEELPGRLLSDLLGPSPIVHDFTGDAAPRGMSWLRSFSSAAVHPGTLIPVCSVLVGHRPPRRGDTLCRLSLEVGYVDPATPYGALEPILRVAEQHAGWRVVDALSGVLLGGVDALLGGLVSESVADSLAEWPR